MKDAISTTFFALADPTRRSILARLALGETTVTEIAEPFKMSMPAISKHLRVLQRAGLISQGREAQRRPCTLKIEALRDTADWLEQYRKFWEQGPHPVDLTLHSVMEEEGATKRGKKKKKKGKHHGKHKK